MFFLHHAQIDRVWAIWQGQDLRGREEEIGGTYMPFDGECRVEGLDVFG